MNYLVILVLVFFGVRYLANNQTSQAISQERAVDIAKHEIESEQWPNGAKFEAELIDGKWCVSAWRVMGFDQGGNPLFAPGGFRIITIDAKGKVISIIPGD